MISDVLIFEAFDLFTEQKQIVLKFTLWPLPMISKERRRDVASVITFAKKIYFAYHLPHFQFIGTF